MGPYSERQYEWCRWIVGRPVSFFIVLYGLVFTGRQMGIDLAIWRGLDVPPESHRDSYIIALSMTIPKFLIAQVAARIMLRGAARPGPAHRPESDAA